MFSKGTSTRNMEEDKFLKESSEGNCSDAAVDSRETRRHKTNLRNHNGGDQTRQEAGVLESLMQIIYKTSAGASILTDLVFWFILCRCWLENNLWSLWHLIGLGLPISYFGVPHVTFQWILHACGFTWWPCPFLELSNSFAPLSYLGLVVIHVPCYGLYYLFVKAKNDVF